MHSRIYQIGTKPIHKDDYIGEDRYYDHWFLNSVADYVNEDTDREEDIEWLKGCCEARGISFGTDDGGEYFIIEDKIKYFEAKFQKFHKVIGELSTITLEDFASYKSDMPMYSLKEAYNNKFGFYIDNDDFYLTTFDDFMRCVDVGTKYYIGATIDYHC